MVQRPRGKIQSPTHNENRAARLTQSQAASVVFRDAPLVIFAAAEDTPPEVTFKQARALTQFALDPNARRPPHLVSRINRKGFDENINRVECGLKPPTLR